MKAALNLAHFSLPDIPETIVFPPLPTIVNGTLEQQVFTHSSYHQRPRRSTSLVSDGSAGSLDNEKLEHVGDSILRVAVTLLLDQLYPGFEAGAATMCKGQLVRDAFLAQISRRYGFPQRLIAAPSERYNLIHGEKPVANLFEAYVAGLYYSYQRPDSVFSPPPTPRESRVGNLLDVDDASQPHIRSRSQARDAVEEWLYELFTPLAHWAVELMRQEQDRVEVERATAGGDEVLDGQAAGATSRLNEYFSTKEGKIPSYESLGMDATGLWTMRCTAIKRDGIALTGEASRSSKQAAKAVAAWKVCQQMDWE